tara:strand:+ start:1092 stop:1364 length:273 start_codon:yes stop_codon:yes gene_type:complete
MLYKKRMTTLNKIKSDTVSILLTNRLHFDLPVKPRAIKIAKCCKIIRDRTSDKVLYDTCRKLINAVSAGKYTLVVLSIAKAELAYAMEYN